MPYLKQTKMCVVERVGVCVRASRIHTAYNLYNVDSLLAKLYLTVGRRIVAVKQRRRMESRKGKKKSPSSFLFFPSYYFPSCSSVPMFTIPILFLPISCPSYGFHFSPPYIHMHIHTCINTYKYVERLHEGRPI